jgi:hypothetical protein
MTRLDTGALEATSASRSRQRQMSRLRVLSSTREAIVLVGLVALLAVVVGAIAPRAEAAFGDNFGIADVNDPDDPSVPTAPAFPGRSAFWAGTCDTASAPIGPTGGVGDRPDHVWVPQFASGEALNENELVPGAPPVPDHCIDFGRLLPGGNPSLWHEGQAPAWRLAPVTQAGAHPDGTATMWFRRAAPDGEPYGSNSPDGSVDNIYADLPAGFVGDPTAVPKCTADQFAVRPNECPPQTQVGVVLLYLTGTPNGSNYGFSNEERLPVFNLEPRHGNVAEFGFASASNEDATTVRIVAKARTNGDFGVTAFAAQIPAALPLLAQSFTLWGTPWAASHDLWRPPTGWSGENLPEDLAENSPGEMPPTGLPDYLQVGYDRTWGRVKPFLSNPTECSGRELSTGLSTDAFEHPGSFLEGFPDLSDPDWKHYESPAPPVTGCEKVPFDPSATFDPSSSTADSASGLTADITIPPNDELPFDPPADDAAEAEYIAAAEDYWRLDPRGLATSHLDKSVVTLPEGMSVNPSASAGLQGCSDAQMGVRQVGNPYLFNNAEPSCPDGSKIGTVEATTPVLEGSPNMTGEVYLGSPKSTDPQSGEMFRVFLVLRNEERGLLAKIYGSSVADPATGRLTATFDKNPRVPVENIKVTFKGGPRGLFGMPQRCGEKATTSVFSPWSAAHGAGGPIRSLSDPFSVGGNCSFGFSPTLTAGMNPRRGGGSGTFTFQFSRNDGEQWFKGLSAKLPQGLLARVKGVPLCTNAQAAANSCPAASRIGSADAGAGSGTPFFLERKGDVYLTEGYKGAPYGLAVSVPVEAGPFRGQFALTPIVVRQALQVDRETAEVTAVSDPLPHIWHGIPLRVRQVTVTVDRRAFMRNPTSCAPKQIAASITSTEGTVATPTEHFQATDCRRLRFKPRLAIRLTGKRQTKTGGHPGVRALLTQPRGQANIKSATTKLPLSLALDTNRAQSDDLCEYEASKTANCPRSSIIGRARAVSPLLKRPLAGNVYFAKNVRINKRGNAIRTLPSLVLALRGEIALNVRANSDSKGGKLISTFPAVPDAPVKRFALNLKGGRKGILQVTKSRTGRNIDICGRQVTEVELDGHNGRRRDFKLRMKTPCSKKKKQSARQRKARR